MAEEEQGQENLLDAALDSSKEDESYGLNEDDADDHVEDPVSNQWSLFIRYCLLVHLANKRSVRNSSGNAFCPVKLVKEN